MFIYVPDESVWFVVLVLFVCLIGQSLLFFHRHTLLMRKIGYSADIMNKMLGTLHESIHTGGTQKEEMEDMFIAVEKAITEYNQLP